MVIYRIENQYAQLLVSEQGAQALSFKPAGDDDLLWLSPSARFKTGTAIRGGVPLCMPWFGVNRHAANTPSHGFARNVNWVLGVVEQLQHAHFGDVTVVKFAAHAHPLFDYPFRATLTFIFNSTLNIELRVENTGTHTMPLSWALHSYLPVDDLDLARVSGLDGVRYLDNTRALQSKVQHGDIEFNEEVDRVFIDVPDQQRLNDLLIGGQGCDSAIVWNPGLDKAAAMADVGEANYRRFVCVERGNAFDNEVQLAPGEIHRATVSLGREPRL